MKTDSEILVEELTIVARGLNLVLKRAADSGLSVDYTPYGYKSEGSSVQFEFTLTKDVREFEHVIKRDEPERRTLKRERFNI